MKYKPNRAGLEQLARGEAAQKLVTEHAEAKASAAGDGFEASYMQGRSRFRAIVYPSTFSAQRREARDNVLLRVLG